MRKENMIRMFVYLSIGVIFVVFVLRMQKDIKNNLAKEVISITNEHKSQGKPAIVRKVIKGDIDVYIKTTIVPTNEGFLRSYVTKNVKDRLSIGQILYVEENQTKRFGEIIFISSGIDINSGLYQIKCILDDKNILRTGRKIAHIYEKTLKNVIYVSNNIVEIEGEKRIVWKVQNGRVKKTDVKVGEQVFGDVVILDGLISGDVVVVEGHTMLKNNDEIKVISDKGVEL